MLLMASMLRLHLQNEMAALSVSVRWMEHTRVGIEPLGAEASFYNYYGNSIKEFVALLLYKDFDNWAAL